MEQISIFDYYKTPLKIDKPIRLIELFAGIGSQAKALKRLGAAFEHYRVCEFDKHAIKSYNAIHGTNFVKSDVTQITADDLGIVGIDKYCYMLTYSFPCQDLSLAGKQKGMAKGENTRSSLLWEVERLLNECEHLPQVLLMENVTQVHGKKNKEHFNEWIKFLESKGYSNYWQDLNAKNFGIPQNRNRTFMVSVLGDYTYEFPQEFPLELRLKDMLESNVEEKFYLSDKSINFFIENTKKQQAKGNGFKFQPTDGSGCGKAVTTRAGGRMDDNFIEEPTCIQVGTLSGGKWDRMHDISRRVYSGEGTPPTLHTCGGGNTEPKIIEPSIVVEPQSCLIQPKDRNYNIKGEKRETHIEIKNDGIAHALRTKAETMVAEPLALDEQNGYVRKDGTVGTLTTDGSSPKHNNRVIEGKKIRKLTPKECFRLMGFDDADFEKAAEQNSNSQLYKQAGNSIVVDVLYYIFKQMF